MKLNIFNGLGSVILLIGVFIISFSYDFTGFAVASEIGNYTGSFLGAGFLILGVLLIFIGKDK